MKKVKALLMAVIMVASLAACSGEDNDTTDNGNGRSDETTKATTTASKDTETESTTESTTTEATTDETPTQASGVWEVKYYVDEFNLPTSEGYVTNKKYFDGTYSNSATTNSDLKATVSVDDMVSVFLFKNGRTQEKNSLSKDVDYDITIRTEDGTKHSVTGFMASKVGDRILIDENHTDTVINLLSGEGTILFSIVETARPSSTYLFEVDTSNFAELYEEFQ
jgi:hypothetical protein